MPEAVSTAPQALNRSKNGSNTPLSASYAAIQPPTDANPGPARATALSRHLREPQPPDYPNAAADLGAPGKIIHFVDAISVWLRSPMSADDLAFLRSHCGGKLRIENRPARFDRAFIQRLTLRQPSREAIAALAKRNDCHFNYRELAMDLIYPSADQRDDAFQFSIEHALMKDRRGQSAKVCLGLDGKTTIYSGPRGKPIVSATYPCKSKITGDEHALHSERRHSGTRALERKSGGSLNELLTLDHIQFWQESAQYWRIRDIEGLGRAYLNYWERKENPLAKSRRKANIIKLGNRTTYNEDRRMGYQLLRTLGLFTDEQITTRKPRTKATADADANAGIGKEQMPGYWTIYAARSIQNVYDRLNQIIPMDRFMERISLDELIARSASSANSEMACYMRTGQRGSANLFAE